MQVEKELDISVNLSSFFLKNIGLWIADDSTNERRRKGMLAYTIWCTFFSTIISSRDLYFTWIYNGVRVYYICMKLLAVTDILYALANYMSVMMILVKICVIVVHKSEFINLIVYMQQYFWNVNYDSREKEILNSCKKTCAFFVSSVTFIGICAILSYLMTPFTARIGNNESERVLPFNMWLNLPLSQTPYYELSFLVQIITLYYIGICYFCFDNVFCIMAIHLTGQFRILGYRFAKLCNIEHEMCEKDAALAKHVHKCYEKFKEYVRYHQALINFHTKLENVYTMIILGQVIVFSVLICLFCYQVLLANAPSARRSIFIFLLIGAVSLLFMFTYSCDGVMEQSDNVAVGAYSALWTIMPMDKFGRTLRRDLIMVIERSRRVCCLTANGFFPVSLETYTTILSTAVSYFTLLRNNIENDKDD
ncbi:odorant receptor 13a-like isoform X1 [Apis cerana]|uniref:odorant receptor 13a-like isoform X1 n=1 Tax=Apis cerana TaxID=7461 RepID=UPI002B225F21|nr:odorant receptor 13a-like isoform X1 [Apis cerana]